MPSSYAKKSLCHVWVNFGQDPRDDSFSVSSMTPPICRPKDDLSRATDIDSTHLSLSILPRFRSFPIPFTLHFLFICGRVLLQCRAAPSGRNGIISLDPPTQPDRLTLHVIFLRFLDILSSKNAAASQFSAFVGADRK